MLGATNRDLLRLTRYIIRVSLQRASMAIQVVWQDEQGEEIDHCLVLWESRLSRRAFLDRSRCLQYIDPHGVTTFNQLQLPRLAREMERAIARCWDPQLKRRAEQVLEFVRACDGPHTYIKFTGA